VSLELVVFDLDGTLVDSEPGIVLSMERTLDALRLPASLLPQWRALIGIPVAEQLRRILPAERRGEIDSGVALYRSFYFQLPADQMGTPFPGIPELLGALRGRVKLAIATSKGRRGLDRVLENLGWTSSFDWVVTPEAVQRGKPDPESLRQILERLGVPAAGALAVGDSRWDVEMGIAAGVEVWGVAWGVGQAGELLAAGAVRCLESVGELRQDLLARL
jgi:phosphoglycolate phosphatase